MPLRPGAEFRPLRPAVRWIHGGQKDSEHPRGKPELVHFFSLSCADCEPQLKRIAELAHELGDEVKIVGVHTPVEVRDMDPEHVREEVDRLGLDYAVALDGDDGALADMYDVRITPSYYVFDSEGRLLRYLAGVEAIDPVDKTVHELASHH